MSIHAKIRAARLRMGMNEQQFGDAVGVTRGAVQQWEKEDGTAPSRKHQPVVARLMGVTVAELMGGGPPAPAKPESDDGELSYLATDLGKMLDEIADEKERRIMHAHCVMLLTKNPVFLKQVGLAGQTDLLGDLLPMPKRQLHK